MPFLIRPQPSLLVRFKSPVIGETSWNSVLPTQALSSAHPLGTASSFLQTVCAAKAASLSAGVHGSAFQGLCRGCWKACWDMSSLDAWCLIGTWQHNIPSEQVQDVTRSQSLNRFRLPVILNVISCPAVKLASHLATSGHWRKHHWHSRPRSLSHHTRKPLNVL